MVQHQAAAARRTGGSPATKVFSWGSTSEGPSEEGQVGSEATIDATLNSLFSRDDEEKAGRENGDVERSCDTANDGDAEMEAVTENRRPISKAQRAGETKTESAATTQKTASGAMSRTI